MLKLKIRGIAAAMLAGAMLAGCSGGGSKSVLPSSPSSTVSTSVTITIGGAGTQSAVRNGQTIPVANSASIVIKYIGDTNYLNPPTNAFAFPSTAATAQIGANAYWNLTGCTVIGAVETCTVPGVTLPIGTIDLYVLDYDGTNGTGNLIYGSVTTVTVTAAGAITNPGTGAAQALTALGGNVAATGASIAFSNVPTAISAAAGTLVAGGQPTTPYFYPAGGFSITAKDANGLAITGTISPIVVTDTDTSGNTCLLLVKGGGAVPASTTCTPVAGSASTVTTSSTKDSIYLQYNNGPLSTAGFKITAAPATGSAPATISSTVTFTPATFVGITLPNSALGGGAVVSLGNTVFVNQLGYTTAGANGATPGDLEALTFKNGALTAATTQPPATTIGAGAGTTNILSLAIGPDSNVWWTDAYATAATAYVGVYAVTQATGPSGAIAKGTVIETGNLNTGAALTGADPNLNAIASYGGYLWAIDTAGDLVRIDPNNVVSGSATAGIVIVKVGTNNNPAPPSGGTYNGGLLGVAGVGLFATTTKGTIVKFAAPSLLLGATSATMLTAGSVSESTANGAASSGLILASDGNVWTANSAGTTNGPFLHVPPSSSYYTITAVGSPATAITFGSIAQGGPDNYIFTGSGTAEPNGALAWTNTAGTSNGLVYDGSAGACTFAAAGAGQIGESLTSLGGYIIEAMPYPSTKVCVAVP